MVKPQSAFYERFGSRGIAVLERVIAESRAAGALVLLDVKRGDIGSTTQAYADAYLDPASPLAADAITASPYLGFGSLDPMVDTARKHDAGLFVLALTSNKEGPEVQHARTEDGQLVAGRVLGHLRALNAGEEPLGSFGAVIGATIGDSDLDFDSTARSWRPASAPRAAPWPTSGASSAARSPRSRRAPRASCCAGVLDRGDARRGPAPQRRASVVTGSRRVE